MSSGTTTKTRQVTTKEKSVFVGNIPYDVTEDQLKEIFSEVGHVVNFRLVYDRDTGKPKGYGFCEFSDGATALSAMRNLNGHEINGRNLRVDFADGGEKTGATGGDRKQNGLTAETVISAITSAIEQHGPLKLYDILISLRDLARKNPDQVKTLLMSYPALTHTIIEAFQTLDIALPLPQPTAQPVKAHTPTVREQTRASVPTAAAAPALGGILGAAPPKVKVQPAPSILPQGSSKLYKQPSPTPSPVSQPPKHVLPAPVARAQISQQPPSGYMEQRSQQPPIIQRSQYPTAGQRPQQPLPVQRSQPQSAVQRSSSSRDPRLKTAPSPANSSAARSRDPRLKRQAASDPRLASKAARVEPPPSAVQHPVEENNNAMAEIEELAKGMTPEKLASLAPEEQTLLLEYMKQLGIPMGS